MTELLDIEPNATPNSWRLFMLRKGDPAFQKFQKKIHERDDYTCRFCGFQAQDFMETVNINHDYANNKIHNLATACPLCAQCFFLDAIGKSDFGGGVLIILPELKQTELNALCHVLFTAIVCQLQTARDAKNIYRSLKLRARLVDEKLGDGLSNPSLYGQVLIDSDPSTASAVKEKVGGALCLLPNMNNFLEQIVVWAQAGTQKLATLS